MAPVFASTSSTRISRSLVSRYLPSGDHVMLPSGPLRSFVSCFGSPGPEAGDSHTCSSPERSDTNAICSPSGDHDGYCDRVPSLEASTRQSPCSTGALMICPRASRNSRLPVGPMAVKFRLSSADTRRVRA